MLNNREVITMTHNKLQNDKIFGNHNFILQKSVLDCTS